MNDDYQAPRRPHSTWDAAKQAVRFCDSEEQAILFSRYCQERGVRTRPEVPGKVAGCLRPKVLALEWNQGGPSIAELDELWREFMRELDREDYDPAWYWGLSIAFKNDSEALPEPGRSPSGRMRIKRAKAGV